MILAVGSEYMRPAIRGADSALMAGEVLENTSLAGEIGNCCRRRPGWGRNGFDSGHREAQGNPAGNDCPNS